MCYRYCKVAVASRNSIRTSTSQGLRDIVSGFWGVTTSAHAGACAAEGRPSPLRLRKVNYMKPLRVPIPMAPKQCNVWEEHR